MTIVRVYILDKDNETSWLRLQRAGRDQTVFGVDAMDPDYGIANQHLSVDRAIVGISIESSSLEPEDLHKEALGRLDVLIHSQRNNRLGCHQSLLHRV
jgi:hypothetical protein